MFELDIENLRLPNNPSKIDEVSDSLVYSGYAESMDADTSSPIWKIMKTEKVADVWEIMWADGNELFDNIWDNRETLDYL